MLGSFIYITYEHGSVLAAQTCQHQMDMAYKVG